MIFERIKKALVLMTVFVVGLTIYHGYIKHKIQESMITDAPLIIIEDDIAPPINPLKDVYYDALIGLSVGQSFKYSATHSIIVTNQIQNAKTGNKKFITKKENETERRVWRIK